MKIGYLITARMKSTRLPGKLTLEINERQIIRWMIDRLKLSPLLDEIIICTSTNSQDDVLETIAREEDVKVFRGSENDVILRLYEASKFYDLRYVLNITADCPLVSVEYISKIIKKYEETQADLIRTLDLPHGFYSYGIKIAAMRKVCEIKKDSNTEVWGRYFTDTDLFDVLDMHIPEDLRRPDYRLTIDYEDDYKLLKKIFKHFGNDAYCSSTYDIITFLDKNPEIAGINKHCRALFKERWEVQNRLMLK